MEIFIGTLLVFLLSCLGLAAGQLFGRKPITGGCTPNAAGHCKHTEDCSMSCIWKKRMRAGE
jgi:hypothetical protein